METGKKFLWKGHDKEKMQKRVVQLCTLTKIWSEIGLLSVNWATPRKKMGVEHIRFGKKQLEFLGLLFHPWKFWAKQSYLSRKNPAKLYETYWEWSQILCDFFFIASPKILVISCLALGSSTFYFFNIPGKSKSWNSQFQDFIWTDKLSITKF